MALDVQSDGSPFANLRRSSQDESGERAAADMLLAPLGLDTFFAQHFERLPLYVSRNDPDYFTGVYSVREIEDSLLLGVHASDLFALVKAGCADVGSDEFTLQRPGIRWRQTGKGPKTCLDPRQVAAFFERGYTLVVKDASVLSTALQRFCNELQSAFSSYVQANVYFSPPSAQGFEVHHDTHDIVVAQIDGEKRWRIYEPLIDLPLESQPFARGTPVAGLHLREEVTLRQGDTLYIPRGYPHEATTGKGRSLHVTFGLMPIRVSDLVHEVLRMVADTEVALRRSLPRGWYENELVITKLADALAIRMAAAFTPERAQAASRSLLGEHFAVTRGDAKAVFGQIEMLASLTPSSTVRFQNHIPHVITDNEVGVNVLVAGRSLDFPKSFASALRRLKNGPTTLADLDPRLSHADKAALVKTLVMQGLIEIEIG